MENKKKYKSSTRRNICIKDSNMWDMIDQVMSHPSYKRSFNKTIIDALFYGLPELMKNLFETKEVLEEQATVKTLVKKIDGTNEVYFQDVVSLLQELVLNVSLNKSMLSSMFNAKKLEYEKAGIKGNGLFEGAYEYTPHFLKDYELEELKNLRR